MQLCCSFDLNPADHLDGTEICCGEILNNNTKTALQLFDATIPLSFILSLHMFLDVHMCVRSKHKDHQW